MTTRPMTSMSAASSPSPLTPDPTSPLPSPRTPAASARPERGPHLLLLHCLLTDGDPAFELEVLFSTRRGRRLLDLSHFGNSSMRHFSSFVRTFALYLDHTLNLRLHAGTAVAGKASILEMSDEEIFSRMHEMQLLIYRFLICRPSGEVKNNRVVIFCIVAGGEGELRVVLRYHRFDGCSLRPVYGDGDHGLREGAPDLHPHRKAAQPPTRLLYMV